MAKLSRNQRHKARQRRTLSLLRREYQKLVQSHQNTHTLLMAVLKQSGGAFVVGKETISAILPIAHNLRWQTTPDQENGSVTITQIYPMDDAVVEPATDEPKDSVMIRVIEDEDGAVDTQTDDIVPDETRVDLS